MAEITFEQELLEVVKQLDNEKQRRVLEFARGLKRPKGESGKHFVESTKHIYIDPEDLKRMEEAIEDYPEVDFL